jgi:hypothetical protein
MSSDQQPAALRDFGPTYVADGSKLVRSTGPRRSCHVRFIPKSVQTSAPQRIDAECHSLPYAVQQAAPLFDRLVSQGKQLVWNFEAGHLRGLEIDNKFELVDLFDRQVSGIDALENSTGVNTAFLIALTQHRSIAHQPTGFDELADFVDRRDRMTCRKRDKVLAPTGEEWVRADEKRIRPLLDKRREDRIEIVLGDGIEDIESLHCSLHVPGLRLGNRTCWIDEERDHLSLGQQLADQLHSFLRQGSENVPNPGDVSARRRQ